MLPGSRDAHLVELLRGLKAPHQMVLEVVSSISAEGATRTEKVRDRLCPVWYLMLSPDSLRKSMEASLETAVAAGQLSKPDYV